MKVAAKDVSVVIPTYGGYDLTPILDTLTDFDEVIVYDNSVREDLGVYGRYKAIEEARNELIATQDDDLIVHCWDKVLALHEPHLIAVNYKPEWDILWLAAGSLFHRDLPTAAHARYLDRYPRDEFFHRWACDAAFTGLTPYTHIAEGWENLPYGLEEGRASTSPGWWGGNRDEAKRRVASLK